MSQPDKDKEEFPSIAEQGKNLAQFTFNVVKDVIDVTHKTNVYVNENVKNERMNICKRCDFYHARQNRCKHCGCWLEHKVKFSISECPIGKWGQNIENTEK
jgi:hypothetical protein